MQRASGSTPFRPTSTSTTTATTTSTSATVAQLDGLRADRDNIPWIGGDQFVESCADRLHHVYSPQALNELGITDLARVSEKQNAQLRANFLRAFEAEGKTSPTFRMVDALRKPQATKLF
jgi:hypothetical protein